MEQSFKSAALTEIREGHSPVGQLKSLSCRDTEKRKELIIGLLYFQTLENQEQALSGREHRPS